MILSVILYHAVLIYKSGAKTHGKQFHVAGTSPECENEY